jgi:hypothetical protein
MQKRLFFAHTCLLTFCIGLLMVPFQAKAVLIDITVTGAFPIDTVTPPPPYSYLTNDPVPGFDPSSAFLNWALPSGGGPVPLGSSGYVFNPNSPQNNVNVVDGTVLRLGDFTHRNNVVDGMSIGGVDLVATVEIAGPGGTDTTELTWSIAHNETPNNPSSGICDAGGSPPCPDLVTLPTIVADKKIQFGDLELFAVFSGFGQSPDSLTQGFLTAEGQDSTAGFFVKFTSTVSEPATLPLLAAALAGLGAVALRRKRAA